MNPIFTLLLTHTVSSSGVEALMQPCHQIPTRVLDSSSMKLTRINNLQRQMNRPRRNRIALHARQQDNSLLEKILTPVDVTLRVLSTPVEPLALPLIYPLAVIFFNTYFNNSTSIIFDVVLIAFYAIIQALNMEGAEEEVDEQNPQQLVAISFFGSVATSLLISPNGFEGRESLPSSVQKEEEVDPSKRLLELFDERLDDDE
eukprot:scaffold3156_cov268-Chaetoceros_neogracile.AAC.56